MRPAVAARARTRARTSHGRRAAASTASRCRSRPHAFGPWRAVRRRFGSVAPVNPFWFVGAAAALWAIILTFVFGLRREDFPRTDREMHTVMLISAVLVAGAIGTAIYGGISGAGADKGVRKGPEPAEAK
jgi:hypothetical protein